MCKLDYVNGGSYAKLSSQGKSQMLGTEMVGPLDETINMPQSSPYHVESLGMYDEVDGKMQWVDNKETRVYHWQGAEWVADGMPRQELGTALRYYRIWAHICFAGYDYREFNGTMPASLSDLETFIASSRNPAAWQGVTVVDSLSAVQSAPGTLFAGTDGGDWVVSCNVGPQIMSARYTYKRGDWKLIGDTFKY